MKIRTVPTEPLLLRNVPSGAVIRCSGDLLIKTDETDDELRLCVHLTDGYIARLDTDELVELVVGEFVIGGAR